MFQKRIQDIASHHLTRDHLLCDGTNSCTYGELPGIFEKLDAWFEKEVSQSQNFMLRCGNSLVEALVLLWALTRKKGVFLLPRVHIKIQDEFEKSNFHPFCQYKIMVHGDMDSRDIYNPYTYLGNEINTNYWGNMTVSGGEGRIYLRTSGSTADPKLVLHGGNQLYRNAENCTRRFSIIPGDRVIIPVPIYHMYGLGAGLLPSVIAGASINLLENTNIITYLEREKIFQPQVAFLTPALIAMFLQTRKSSFPYKLVVTAGDRISQNLYRDFEKKYGILVNLYGSTELGAIATSLMEEPLTTREQGEVIPMPGVTIRFEKVKNQEECEEQSVCEIYCKHEFGLTGYVDKQGKLLDEPITWFRTMDLGREVDEKHFRVCGRTGNAMNRNGILVAFLEVESLVEQGVDSVKHVVVIAKDESGARGGKLVAFCELKEGFHLTGESIRSLCFSIMQRHMVPDEVIVSPRLPRLANGKFDRRKLAESLQTALNE